MQDISDAIVWVEKKWFGHIFNHLNNLYFNVHLPSHDVEHHLRVWSICKDLVRELSETGVEFTNDIIEQCIVACLFHDTGLILDKSENHGYQSRLICEDFFIKNPSLEVKNLQTVLSAIEHHDDKRYKEQIGIQLNDYAAVNRLVSAADDLDAFGYIGIFRYTEIYFIRQVPLNEIPEKIMNNLTNRFMNFENSFSVIKGYVEENRERFMQAFNFFQNLGFELKSKNSNDNQYLRIVESLVDGLINKRMSIYQTTSSALDECQDGYHQHFFKSLMMELKETNGMPC